MADNQAFFDYSIYGHKSKRDTIELGAEARDKPKRKK